MKPRVVMSVMALLMLGVLAGWAWSAEEAEQAQAPAAEAEAEVGAVAEAEAEGEVEEPPEKVKGWLCEMQLGTGTTRRMRAGVAKLTATRLARDKTDGNNVLVFIDAEEGVTYRVSVRQTPATLYEEASVKYTAEKNPWAEVDRQRQADVDGAIQRARMGLGGSRDAAREFQRQIEALEAYKQPATLEATEETKAFGDHECVKYTLTQGDRASGIVWVAKDIEVDAPIGAMFAHSVEVGRGGLSFLNALDELDGFPLRTNVKYYLPGKRSERTLRLWFDTVAEAEFDVTELQIPPEATVSEAEGSRFRRSGMPAGPPEGGGREQRPPDMGRRR